MSEATFRSNMIILGTIEKHGFAHVPIAEVSYSDIDMFLKSIASGYSNGMIKRLYQTVKRAFVTAKQQGIIEKNIMESNDLRRPIAERKACRSTAFTEKEQIDFERALSEYVMNAGTNDYREQLWIALYSGLRMGEINALTGEDIDFDFDRKVIPVRRTVSIGINGRPILKERTKTNAGMRDVPIAPQLIPHLEKVMKSEASNPYGLLFYNYKADSIISTNLVNGFFQRVLKKAGISKRGQHSLRHTFATRCIESGIVPVVLKTWMGHSDIHMTLDVYADVFSSMHNESIDMLSSHMGNIVESNRENDK